LWTYQVPDVSDVDLTTGADVAFQDLSTGAFTRITSTQASRVPSPGSATSSPFIADDNRDATISDDGKVMAFVSTRDLCASGACGSSTNRNADGNPEIFLFNRDTSIFTQVTSTADTFNSSGRLLNPVYNENPCLAGSGSSYVLAFVSDANLTGNNDDGGGI